MVRCTGLTVQAPQTLAATAPPVVVNLPAVTTVSPQPLAAPALDTNTIKSMIALYGGSDAPLNQYADQLAGATQYPFWRDNPELLALIPSLETSSGRNITRPNNITNWGINYPGNNALFEKMTKQQVLDRFISGLGERDKNYAEFRTGKPLTDEELTAFSKKYSNGEYGQKLVDQRNNMRQVLGLH